MLQSKYFITYLSEPYAEHEHAKKFNTWMQSIVNEDLDEENIIKVHTYLSDSALVTEVFYDDVDTLPLKYYA